MDAKEQSKECQEFGYVGRVYRESKSDDVQMASFFANSLANTVPSPDDIRMNEVMEKFPVGTPVKWVLHTGDRGQGVVVEHRPRGYVVDVQEFGFTCTFPVIASELEVL